MPKTTSASRTSIHAGASGLCSSAAPEAAETTIDCNISGPLAGESEHERERDTDDRERLGEREAEDGDGLQPALGLGLARDTVDVRGEDQTDADARADCSQAVADHVEVAFHGRFLSVVPTGPQCSSARAPEMYMALSSA